MTSTDKPMCICGGYQLDSFKIELDFDRIK